MWHATNARSPFPARSRVSSVNEVHDRPSTTAILIGARRLWQSYWRPSKPAATHYARHAIERHGDPLQGCINPSAANGASCCAYRYWLRAGSTPSPSSSAAPLGCASARSPPAIPDPGHLLNHAQLLVSPSGQSKCPGPVHTGRTALPATVRVPHQNGPGGIRRTNGGEPADANPCRKA